MQRGGHWRGVGSAWSIRTAFPEERDLASGEGRSAHGLGGGGAQRKQLWGRPWPPPLHLGPGIASPALLFSLWVLRYPADCTPAHRDWGTPCLHANIQGSRDPCVQLCATTLVKPAAHPSEWGSGGRGERAVNTGAASESPVLCGRDSYQLLSCFSSVIPFFIIVSLYIYYRYFNMLSNIPSAVVYR